jgi:prepilin-type N-terminal cleavage/methylation domain-containing protein/prepilin-type processing-associated H-X9-DG protein
MKSSLHLKGSSDGNSADFRLAFTMVEMLTVLTIISIVLGILIPVLSRAKARTKSVGCQSNLRQLGVSVRLYAEANRGFLPSAPLVHPVDSSWIQEILSELPNEIFRCPSDGGRIAGGVSYDWNNQLNGKLLHKVSMDGNRLPGAILFDRVAIWHGHVNAVFADGHVSKLAR